MYEAFQALGQAYPAFTVLCAIVGAALFATVATKWFL